MTNLIIHIIIRLLRLLNYIIPKKKNLYVFISDPDFKDNPKALYDWILENVGPLEKYDLKWLIRDKGYFQGVKNKKKFVYSKSLTGGWTFIRAEVVITSHNQLAPFSSSDKQIFVSLGHGIYFKTMGYMKPRTHLNKKERKKRLSTMEYNRKSINIMAATSGTCKTMLASCYHLEGDKVKITGLPRMDDLFKPDNTKVKNKWFPDVSYDKLFIFMPTHRKNEEGNLKEGESMIEAFLNKDLSEFYEMLENQNAVFLIKLHPFEFNLIPELSKKLLNKRVSIVEADQMEDLSLYSLLGTTDCLITDYSSVYFEYLALNKPIIFVNTDLEEYENSRTMLLTPYKEWTPGSFVKSLSELTTEVANISNGKDDYQDFRERVRNILLENPDANSSMRVWNEIQSVIKS